MDRKKLILILIFLNLVVFAAANAQAVFFGDLLNRFFPSSPLPTTTSTLPSQPAKPTPLYKPVLEYEEAVISVVEKVSRSVVSVIISKDLPVLEQCSVDLFSNLPPEFRQFFVEDNFRVLQPCNRGKTERKEVGGGTGFVIDARGLVATNKHIVLDDKAEYTVLTNDGKKYQAKVIAVDKLQDLAILKIDAANLVPLKLGDSDEVKLGQTAIAIGNALGEFRNTVSVGVVSGLARKVRASGPGISEVLDNVIQTDAAINPGNSGGPLLNLKGEVIGVNTAVALGAENIGFAIPINKLKKAINSVKATGRIVVPYLGVRYVTVTPEIAKRDKLSVNYGALVRGSEDGPAVIPSSPASKAGILAEDVIIEVQGEPVKESLVSLIQKYRVGEAINLKISRGRREFTVMVILKEAPSS